MFRMLSLVEADKDNWDFGRVMNAAEADGSDF